MFSHAYTIARVAGIPIRVHITLLILLPLLLLQFPMSLWVLGLAAMAGFFASIALHELGHALVSMRFGCRARDIVLLPIGGVAQLECLPRSPRQEMLIAAAGPAVSLLLALAGSLAAKLLDAAGARPAALVAGLLGQVNLTLALFNLIPSFPMDGGRIFRAFLSPFLGRLLATRIASWIGRAFAVGLGVWSVLGPDFRPMTLVLAIFLFQAAGAEWRQTLLQEVARPRRPFEGFFGGGTETPGERRVDDEIVVGPPPYERRAPRRAFADFLDALRRRTDDWWR
ncbi:MAG: site-2 protease family protein [Lentisphaerae bacterium]|nr:site-2 protease family protein [Lentisphaerota bacterium]